MRISFAFAAIVLAGGVLAQADDPSALSGEPALRDAAANAAAVEIGGAVANYDDANHLSWHLPFYYGRGEGRLPCPCRPAPDGTAWGCCSTPRSYYLHLWDDYCYETTHCPSCGHRLGGMGHYFACEHNKEGGFWTTGCGQGCSHGCAGRAASHVDVAAEAGQEDPKTPAPKRITPPTAPSAKREPSPSSGAKSATKAGYQLYGADAPVEPRPVATWPLLDRLRGASTSRAR